MNAVNPFEDLPSEGDEGGGAFQRKLVHAIADAAEEAKRSVLSEAGDLVKAAKKLDEQASFAKRIGNSALMHKLQAMAVRLGNALKEFIWRAIELAIFKLVLELCAQIMKSVMEAITKTGGKMDITTPGVYCTLPGQGPAQPTSNGNPFAGTFGGAAAISPW